MTDGNTGEHLTPVLDFPAPAGRVNAVLQAKPRDLKRLREEAGQLPD